MLRIVGWKISKISIVFSFCNRDCNTVADKVAKVARFEKINFDWLFSYASWILRQPRKDRCISYAPVAVNIIC